VPNPVVEVIPYLCDGDLRISVSVDGKEVYDDFHSLETLFTSFATCVDPKDDNQYLEAITTRHKLRVGAALINSIL
jgi:hypothetical protein